VGRYLGTRHSGTTSQGSPPAAVRIEAMKRNRALLPSHRESPVTAPGFEHLQSLLSAAAK
jgi:hypothetical protein